MINPIVELKSDPIIKILLAGLERCKCAEPVLLEATDDETKLTDIGGTLFS